jgi:hypothetical protein
MFDEEHELIPSELYRIGVNFDKTPMRLYYNANKKHYEAILPTDVVRIR